jgi:hypothetical protein
MPKMLRSRTSRELVTAIAAGLAIEVINALAHLVH